MTIREHCDSIRQEIDLAREIALESIHKASNTLMTEIDAYERDCLSSWSSVKESTVVTMEDVSKRMRAFLVEQQAFLQRVQASDDEMTLHLDEANKLAQELNERKKQLKTAMFSDKLASFITFPSIGVESLGELAFSHIQLPFKHLDMISTDLKQVDILIDYDFLLPLNSGQCIVTFKQNTPQKDSIRSFTHINSFDWAGRIIGSSEYIARRLHVELGTVAQCGPNEFVVSQGSDEPELLVYDSSLTRLRDTRCRSFSNICCNSKFVFGLWDTKNHYNCNYVSDSDDDDDNLEEEHVEQYSSLRIQVHHLDTLSEAFELRVSAKYTMKRIMADEHHLVAMSQLDHSSRQWFMSIFDLQASDEKQLQTFSLVERHIDLMLAEPLLVFSVFLLDGWLVVPRKNELVWFDKKEGKRSETSTRLSNISEVLLTFLSVSSLLFVLDRYQILLKR